MSRPLKPIPRTQYGPPPGSGITDNVLVVQPYEQSITGKPWMIALHGRSGSGTNFHPSTTIMFGDDVCLWIHAGMVVFAPSFPTNGWSRQAELDLIDAIYTYATATLGCSTTGYLFGWSMGGMRVLNWMRRNASKVRGAVLFAPATNQSWHYSNGDPQSTELDAAFGGNWAANHSGFDPIADANAGLYDGLNVPTWIIHGDVDDITLLSQSQAFAAAADSSFSVLPISGDHTQFRVSSTRVLRHLLGEVAA